MIDPLIRSCPALRGALAGKARSEYTAIKTLARTRIRDERFIMLPVVLGRLGKSLRGLPIDTRRYSRRFSIYSARLRIRGVRFLVRNSEELERKQEGLNHSHKLCFHRLLIALGMHVYLLSDPRIPFCMINLIFQAEFYSERNSAVLEFPPAFPLRKQIIIFLHVKRRRKITGIVLLL